MSTVAIMQPTFLPWLGYFAMIEQVDHFVFLDDVQFSKQSWQSRNRIKGPNGEVLLSLSVARKPSKPLIKDARLAETGFEAKLVETVRQAYAKAPNGKNATDLVETSFAKAGGSLARLNIGFIKSFCALTQIKATFHRSSDMAVAVDGRSDRLIAMARALGCTRYLSPVGSALYLAEDNAFEGAEVALDFLNFTPHPYDQGGGRFLSHLSALDALAHVGTSGVRHLVRSGLGPPLKLDDVLDQA